MRQVIAKLKGQRWNAKKVAALKKRISWQTHKVVSFAFCPKWEEVYRLGVQREALYLSRLPVSTQSNTNWNVRYKLKLKADSLHHERESVGLTMEAQWNVRRKWVIKGRPKFSMFAAVFTQGETNYNSYFLVNKCAGTSWDTLQNPAAREQTTDWHVHNKAAQSISVQWDCAGPTSVQAEISWNVQHFNVQAGTSWGVKCAASANVQTQANARLTTKKSVDTLWFVRKRLWFARNARYKVFRPLHFVEHKVAKHAKELRGAYLPNITLNALDKKKRLQLGIE